MVSARMLVMRSFGVVRMPPLDDAGEHLIQCPTMGFSFRSLRHDIIRTFAAPLRSMGFTLLVVVCTGVHTMSMPVMFSLYMHSVDKRGIISMIVNRSFSGTLC